MEMTGGDIEAQQYSSVSISSQNLVNKIDSKIAKAEDADSFVEKIVQENAVAVFSKTLCGFSLELKRLLSSYGIPYCLVEVDESNHANALKAALNKISGISTVPNVFVNGVSIKGCTDIKTLEHNGEFMKVFSPFLKGSKARELRVENLSLFWFPEIVNGDGIRLTSAFSHVIGILCLGFYDRPTTKWIVLALALDYVLRLVFGGTYSPIAMIANVLLARRPPRFVAGPPKQFASFCGLFFNMFAAGLLLANQQAGGAVVLAMFVFASFLEAAFDFCLGCWFFARMIELKLVAPSIYRPYIAMINDKKWSYKFANPDHKSDNTYPPSENYPPTDNPSLADLKRKNRLEPEDKQQDYSIIRHCRIEFFGMPMAIAALAYMFKSSPIGYFGTGIAYKVCAVFSVVLWGLLSLLYIARFILHPKKTLKEWRHPIMGNFFTAHTICITLFGLLLMPISNAGGISLIWIGAGGQMLITVIRVSDLIYMQIGEEMINPSIMMAPVGNFISAIALSDFTNEFTYAPNAGVNYLSVARLWFGVAMLFAIVLFTITFRKAVHDHHSDNRLRPTLFIWLATASVVGPAFVQVSGDFSLATGVFYQSTWSIALLFFALIAVGCVRNFFTYEKDMSIWIMPFSFAAFALNTLQYYNALVGDGNDLFFTLSIITIVVACASSTVCLCHTAVWFLEGTLFTPRGKWGPISFLKLTHESWRFGLPKLELILNNICVTNEPGVVKFLEILDGTLIAYAGHGRYEDSVIFPTIRRYFPMFNPSVDEEHKFEHHGLLVMEKAIEQYRAKEITALAMIDILKATFPHWVAHVLPHLRNEEATVSAVARKYLTVEQQKVIAQQCFDMVTMEEWRKSISVILDNLPNAVWKARFVKSFTWSMPHRAQEIGLMLYQTVDSVTWLSIAREIPEIVPRGVPGYVRIY